MNDRIEEIPLSPEKARNWLLKTGRAQELDGVLHPTEAEDHLTIAGIQIAKGTEPKLLSQVYFEVSPNHPHIQTTVLRNIAEIAMTNY